MLKAGFYITKWQRTPWWLFWKPKWRRAIIARAEEDHLPDIVMDWKYADDAEVGTDCLLNG